MRSTFTEVQDGSIRHRRSTSRNHLAGSASYSHVAICKTRNAPLPQCLSVSSSFADSLHDTTIWRSRPRHERAIAPSISEEAPCCGVFFLQNFIASFRNVCLDSPVEMRLLCKELDHLRSMPQSCRSRLQSHRGRTALAERGEIQMRLSPLPGIFYLKES